MLSTESFHQTDSKSKVHGAVNKVPFDTLLLQFEQCFAQLLEQVENVHVTANSHATTSVAIFFSLPVPSAKR